MNSRQKFESSLKEVYLYMHKNLRTSVAKKFVILKPVKTGSATFRLNI